MASAVATGCFEMDAVAGVGDHRERGAAESAASRSPSAVNFGVVLADDDEDGDSGSRRVGPTAVPGSRCRWIAGSTPVRPPCCAAGRSVGRLVGSSPANNGFVSHSSTKTADADRLDVLGQTFVGRVGGRRVRSSASIPAVAPISTSALDDGRMGDRSVERDAAAHRVADVRRRSTELASRWSALCPQVGVGRRAVESPCPGMSTATMSALGDAARRSTSPTVVPRPRGLGEAVGEHDAPARRESSSRRISGRRSYGRHASRAILRSTWANVSGSCAPGTAHLPLNT